MSKVEGRLTEALLFERFDLLRFPLIVGVLYIHAYETSVGLAGGVLGAENSGAWAEFIRNFISQSLARVAVPLFFFMSGYLFFATWQGPKSYWQKIRARCITLLCPFLFWNIVAVAILILVQELPLLSNFNSGKVERVSTMEASAVLAGVFGIGRAPFAYQFWFIRDLMMLVLISPLIYVGRRIWLPVLIILLTLWLGRWPFFYSPSIDASFFFCLGAFLSIRKIVPNFDKVPIGLAWFLVVALPTVTVALRESPAALLVHRVAILGLLVATLVVAGGLPPRVKEFLTRAAPSSFFIFAAHEPILTISRKVVYKLFHPESEVVIVVIYLLVPILLTICLLAFFFATRRSFGEVYRYVAATK